MSFLTTLTEATCGEACWHAREDICYCSCGGKNHGCLRTASGEQPERTAKIDGYRYKLLAVGLRRDATLWKDANTINGQGWSAINHVTPALTYHYRWIETDAGAPARLKYASKSQLDKWPELAMYKGEHILIQRDVILLWVRVDMPAFARCSSECERCTKMYETNHEE